MLLAEITYEPHCTSLQKFMLNIIFPMQMKTIYTFLREHNIFPHFLFYPLLPLTTSIMPSLTIFIPLRLRCISEFRTPLSLYFVPCSLHTSRIRGFPLSMTTNPTIYYTYTSSSLIQSVRMTNIDETHTESMNFIRCHYILLTKLCVGLLDEWRALRDRSPARHHQHSQLLHTIHFNVRRVYKARVNLYTTASQFADVYMYQVTVHAMQYIQPEPSSSLALLSSSWKNLHSFIRPV